MYVSTPTLSRLHEDARLECATDDSREEKETGEQSKGAGSSVKERALE